MMIFGLLSMIILRASVPPVAIATSTLYFSANSRTVPISHFMHRIQFEGSVVIRILHSVDCKQCGSNIRTSFALNFFLIALMNVSFTLTKDSPMLSSLIPINEPMKIHIGYMILMKRCTANCAIMKLRSVIVVKSTRMEPMTSIKKKILNAVSRIKGNASLNSCKRGEMKYQRRVTVIISTIKLIVESQRKSDFPAGFLFFCKVLIKNIGSKTICKGRHYWFSCWFYSLHQKESVARRHKESFIFQDLNYFAI